MSTFNGIGTLNYGWQACDDGTAIATTWFVIGFFPIVPLRRQRVRILQPPGAKVTDVLIPAGFRTRMQIVERLPLDYRAIVRTYLKGFVLVPLLIALPLIIARGVTWIAPFPQQPAQQKDWQTWLLVTWAIGMFVYWAVLVAKILDRAAARGLKAPPSVNKPGTDT